MLASCDHCFAEYELDDAKIPAGGARLRCKKCDQFFVISPPETSDLQSADDLAHDALSSGDQGEVEPDLEAAKEEQVGAKPEPEAAQEEEFDPDEESDWQFNDMVEVSEPDEEVEEELESAFDRDGEFGDLAVAEEVVDDLLGSSGGVEVDADAAAAVDDLLGEIDTDGLRPDEIDTADSQRVEIDAAESPLGESGGDLTAGPETPSEHLDPGEAGAIDAPGEDLAAAGGDSLGDLSDWDLFDQPADADGSAMSAGAGNFPAARVNANAAPQVEIAVALADDTPTEVRWADRVSEIAGWGAACLMIIVSLVGGLVSNSSDARAPAGSWSGAGFEADQIVGRWVDNAVAGSVYVVSGRIRGAPSSDRASQKTVGIRLIDTEGREIDRAPIPLAPEVPERILRESSPAELDAFQTRRATQIAVLGERWVPFEAVLTDLP
ncbi:MAG: zinc-ribbon domain-containing protein, partial [Deltaproteobacteria bacterium]|nr:zinc-ribbon domain-containing protein [Deltaproteobacteria bacterium]